MILLFHYGAKDLVIFLKYLIHLRIILK